MEVEFTLTEHCKGIQSLDWIDPCTHIDYLLVSIAKTHFCISFN